MKIEDLNLHKRIFKRELKQYPEKGYRTTLFEEVHWTKPFLDDDKFRSPLKIAIEGHKLMAVDGINEATRFLHKNGVEQLEIGEYKIFDIDEELKSSLYNTKNKIFYRKSPFVKIFLNLTIDFNESLKISQKDLLNDRVKETGKRKVYGLSIIDMGQGKEYLKGIVKVENQEELIMNGIIDCENISLPTSIFQNIVKPEEKEYSSILSKDERNKIRNFVCNFLDFLNHPDVETRLIKHQTNESRIKRGKLPIPDRVQINVKGKLYKYIYEDLPKQEHNSPDISFWVRGHYIHFWNKKKWKGIYSKEISDLKEKGYQLDSNGIISKWILPYIKGKGILVNKNYKIKL